MHIKKERIIGATGLKESYNHYKNTYTDPVDYKCYSECIKRCNKKIIDLIVNQSEIIELPYRLGLIHINKYEKVYSSNKNKWAIDFKKTKELGFTVYFDQKFIYRWSWKRNHAIVRNKSKYKFTASRFAKRAVPKALKNKTEYCNI